MEIKDALADLQAASLVIYRKFNAGYSIFEGSDFDIEQAVEAAYGALGALDYTRLAALAGLQPIIAKRHYHETGALRWYDTLVVPLSEVVETAATYAPRNGATGAFLLALPTPGGLPRDRRADRPGRCGPRHGGLQLGDRYPSTAHVDRHHFGAGAVGAGRGPGLRRRSCKGTGWRGSKWRAGSRRSARTSSANSAARWRARSGIAGEKSRWRSTRQS